MVRNPSVNTGNTGSIPDPRRSHMTQSNKATTEPSSRATTEACTPKPVLPQQGPSTTSKRVTHGASKRASTAKNK